MNLLMYLLERIAAIAGVNNAEIAKLFSSEEKIYEAVLEYQFSKFTDKLNAVFVGNEGPRDKIELCTKTIFDLNREAPYFFVLLQKKREHCVG